MKKFVAILVSLITLGVFIFLAWWLYRTYHSTPMLVINLLLVLTGVMTSLTLYYKIAFDSKNKRIIPENQFPEIETGIIYAQINDFVNKCEKNRGQLFIVGIETPPVEYKLEKVNYDKLTDEITLTFSPSLKITLTGVATVGVGDKQFLVYGFETAHIKMGEDYFFDWKHDKLMLSQGEDKPVHLKLPAQMPTIVFSW